MASAPVQFPLEPVQDDLMIVWLPVLIKHGYSPFAASQPIACETKGLCSDGGMSDAGKGNSCGVCYVYVI